MDSIVLRAALRALANAQIRGDKEAYVFVLQCLYRHYRAIE